ncbi:MAG: TolC family protein [Myxococcales bacterium]|nr:TolC family protein [Myxococcales bacterium]
MAIATAGSHASADDRAPFEKAERLTIDDLLKVAVRVAPELEAAAFDVAVARANRQAAEGVTNWNAAAAVNKNISKLVAATSSSLDTQVLVSKLLPTNGVVAVGAGVSQQARTEPRATSQFTTIDLSLSVKQPLLAGSGTAIRDSQIRATQSAMSAATIRRSASARVFVADLAEAYWRLALAWRRLDVLHLSLDAAEKQLATIQRGLTSGAIAKSEALPFAQSIASRKIDIANAENDIVAQSISLRTLAGLEIPPDAPVVRTIDLPRADAVTIDTADLVKKALATSDQLEAALEDARGAEAGVVAARRNLLPTLDLTLTGDITSTHQTFSQALEELRYSRGYSLVAGASFSLPVGRDAEKGAYAAKRALLARARFDIHTARRTIAAEVVGLASQARTSARTVELSSQVVTLAQQNVEAEQRKFELGKSTSNEVVRRQNELENARLQLESASADATIALTRLEALSGQILQHYGIKMIDPDELTGAALDRRP